MFRAAHRSSSGAPTVFAASGLHTHVVTGRMAINIKFINAKQATEIHAYKNTKESCTKRTQPSGLTRLASSSHSDLTMAGHHMRRLTRGCKDSWSSCWWAVCCSKHVEPLMNVGIINSITRMHLVGYLSWFVKSKFHSRHRGWNEDWWLKSNIIWN
jgi:hypothetical protein